MQMPRGAHPKLDGFFMVPRKILAKLGQLRRRERALRLIWGVSCFVTLVAAVVLFGCVVDWVWDRTEDTPFQVHSLLLSLTCIAASIGFLVWVAAPPLESLPDDDLALLVEEKHPNFRSRLISAVQLNRPNANRDGMSAELIDIMTGEAEQQAAATSFTAVADHGRLGRALLGLASVAAIAGALYLWQPQLAETLLARHLLSDIDIPHRTHLEPIDMASVYPAGEKLPLRFAVTGDGFDESTVGVVDVAAKGQPRDRYPLKFSHHDEATGASIFTANVSGPTVDFDFLGRIGDGRMRKANRVRVVPRPAVMEQYASTVLPAYCGVRPSDGARYEVPQGRGDVIGIPGSAAKIVVTTQKPIASAAIETLAPEKIDPNKPLDESGPEIVKRTIPFTLKGDKTEAIAQFDLLPNESAYRILLTDEHGLKNLSPPRRNLRLIAEEAPTVVLLKDYFTPGQISSKESLEDFAIEGMPVPVGEDLRVPYLAEGPYGLGQAWFLYRILKKTESGNDVVEEEPWKRLALPEVFGNDQTGPFDQRRGVFQKTPPDKGVSFVALPSPDPETILGRTLGGGRFHFKTTGIPDGKGGVITLNDGDKLEYCIEIHADQGKHPERPIARSESRVQTFGSYESLGRWIRDLAQEERRLRELDGKQRSVFANP